MFDQSRHFHMLSQFHRRGKQRHANINTELTSLLLRVEVESHGFLKALGILSRCPEFPGLNRISYSSSAALPPLTERQMREHREMTAAVLSYITV